MHRQCIMIYTPMQLQARGSRAWGGAERRSTPTRERVRGVGGGDRAPSYTHARGGDRASHTHARARARVGGGDRASWYTARGGDRALSYTHARGGDRASSYTHARAGARGGGWRPSVVVHPHTRVSARDGDRTSSYTLHARARARGGDRASSYTPPRERARGGGERGGAVARASPSRGALMFEGYPQARVTGGSSHLETCRGQKGGTCRGQMGGKLDWIHQKKSQVDNIM